MAILQCIARGGDRTDNGREWCCDVVGLAGSPTISNFYLPDRFQGLYNTVSSCLVTLHYYVGFCHMMMRHYQDAIRLFVNCQLFIQRTRNINQQQQQQHKSWQYDVVSTRSYFMPNIPDTDYCVSQISKTNDQLYNLLAICLSLQPQRIDESVQSQLTEKMSEKMSRMQRG